MSIHNEREQSLLVEKAAEYIAREAGRNTLITPLRALLSKDGKNVTILVSVYPTEESEHAITFLTRHKDLFRNFLKKETRLARLPYITFDIDYGERNRQHLDDISGHV
jgi:ribosome-binding factor A